MILNQQIVNPMKRHWLCLMVVLIFAAMALPASAGGYVLSLPRPINPSELSRYAVVLTLSEEQQFFLSKRFEEYVGAHDETMTATLPEVERLSSEAAATTGEFTREGIEAFRRFWTAQQELRTKLTALDREMHHDLRTVLTEAQAERFFRVEWMRERAASFTLNWMPAARIDLSELLTLPSTTAVQDLDGLLLQYEVAVTSLFRELDEATREITIPLMELVHQARFDADGNTIDPQSGERQRRGAIYLSEMRRLLAPASRLQERIASLNEQFLPVLLAALPIERGEQFEAAYLRMAYRKVFPDESDARPLAQGVLATRDTTPHLRESLDEIALTHQQAYARVNDEFKRTELNWQKHMAANRGYRPAQYDAHAAEMRKLRDARYETNLRFAAQMREALAAEKGGRIADLIARIDKYLAQTQAHRDAHAQETGWPGP